ncbi:hypothetical protein [Sphingomonas quercus]|uniref:Right handed beta helix region n=1 Tax=Sphingomonas quercus TaxID=2842451 RepID=A0ABS6BNG1_9SPHN|nr:hypothetical protein [Sphingomonas quercus]MBU3078789.1 hypothetical protein [Sphingomonas quercus]
MIRSIARRPLPSLGALLLLGLGSAAPAAPGAGDVTVQAGSFLVELPTLQSLGFEWNIKGDANRNSMVTVSYRKAGSGEWRKGLPMLRLDGEFVRGPKPEYGDRNYFNYRVPNMFAGSILGLDPDTDYECRFILTDPDGVVGTSEQVVTVHTRKEPMPASGGHVYHVYPFGYKGEMQQPGFIGLMTAYYLGSDESDHYNLFDPRVQPGDTILIHAGVYKDARFIYGGIVGTLKDPAYGTPFDGTYYLTASGTPDKPIVIKAAGDGEVVFDGDGAHNLFNLEAASYNYFEGITVRNTNVAFLLGMKRIVGASGFTLKHSLVYDVGRVVQDEWAGSRDFYIADNVFLGRHNPTRMTSWIHDEVWAKYGEYPAPITSEYAVKVYGRGHVIARNYVANFHDAIDIATYGSPSDNPGEQASSIDVYRNDMFNQADNCVELDGGVHNVRAYENRCVNASNLAYSTQPIFGGPAYIYRNLLYNAPSTGALKLLDNPAGVLIYQNSFIGLAGALGALSNVHLRNNLFVSDGWAKPLFQMRTFTNYSTSDYNGFGPSPGVDKNFGWNSPPAGVAADYDGPLVARAFATLAEYQKGTGQDRHSAIVTLQDFVKVAAVDTSDPRILYKPEDMDFRLRPRSRAIDRGVELPGITDGFAGRAPDLGAYEFGAPLPHYGPDRWPVGMPRSAARSEAGPPPDQ